MTNKEKYEGRTVNIISPFNGRNMDTIKVIDVFDDNCLYGRSVITSIETDYYISDGISVEIVN